MSILVDFKTLGFASGEYLKTLGFASGFLKSTEILWLSRSLPYTYVPTKEAFT